jgi:pimeloyl-ACP methyl ester carboxylesterase
MNSCAITDPAAVVDRLESSARRYEIPCGDGTMVWRAWGSGPPLFLAHGSHGAWSHWIHNIDALAARYTVWAPDLPGNGDSAMPPADDHATLVGLFEEGLRRFVGTDSPLDVVGFSMGGVLCAYLAAAHPEMVRRLVLVDTGGLDTPHGGLDRTRVRGLEGEERRAAHRFNLLGLMLHKPESADDLAVYLNELNGFRGRLNAAPLVLPDRLLAILPQVKAQVDAIWGEFDRPHPNPDAQAKALRLSHPDLEMHVIPGAGHWSMYEGGEVFNKVLLDLLAKPLRPARA